MVDVSKAFDISEHGVVISDNTGNIIWMGGASGAPSFSAPKGSFYHDTTNNQFYYNTALGDNWTKLDGSKIAFSSLGFDALDVTAGIIEAKNDAIALPRFPIIANHNGTLSNGQLVGYTNLLNNPIVVPIKCSLAEVTMYNNNSGADADYRFYKNTETAPNLFFTWSLTNTQTAVAEGQGVDFTSPTFNAGDLLRVYFDDQGTNTSDLSMGFFFQAVE